MKIILKILKVLIMKKLYHIKKCQNIKIYIIQTQLFYINLKNVILKDIAYYYMEFLQLTL